MRTRALICAAALSTMVFVGLAGEGHGFEILTALSDPCHENLALGVFDLRSRPFSSPDDESMQPFLNRMIERAREEGVPSDEASRGAISYIAEHYNLDGYDLATKYVLASLVIGVRDPDTRGFSVVRLNVTRTTHIADDLQDEHSLRRTGDDYEAGNHLAVQNIRRHIKEVVRGMHTKWHEEPLNVSTVWTFPHYGEQDIRVFGPAYKLGVLIHTIQDAFTHMLRDEEGRVVHVLNFVEASTVGVVEVRDGVAHSERLDECEVDESSFDVQRVSMARDATHMMTQAVYTTLSDETYDPIDVEEALDQIYEVRDGCTFENGYCNNSWVDIAREEQTEPLDISLCTAVPLGRDTPTTALLLLLAPLGWALWRRQ